MTSILAGQEPRPLLPRPGPGNGLERALSPEARRAEVEEKVARLQGLMERRQLEAVLLTAVHNFEWLTAGGSSRIVHADRAGPAALLVRRDGRRYLVTNNSEAARLMEEDLAGLGFELRLLRWYEELADPGRRRQLVAQAAGPGRLGTDLPYPGAVEVEEDLRALRSRLTDNEIARLRWIGRRAAEAVEAVARSIAPGMTEREIEAMTADALRSRGLEPTVLLTAVDDRILRYRHAPPTDRRLERYAMINICARRWGLVVAMTRLVHFGPVPEALAAKLRAVAQVEATYLAATRPGATAEEVLAAARRAYAEVGYPEEWREHHQGGAIGYLEREWVAYPGLTERIQERQGVAWNPTIRGTKVEDTILVWPDHNELLTEIPGWPTVTVTVAGREYRRPAILVRAENPRGPVGLAGADRSRTPESCPDIRLAGPSEDDRLPGCRSRSGPDRVSDAASPTPIRKKVAIPRGESPRQRVAAHGK